jgi:hypothetical protein
VGTRHRPFLGGRGRFRCHYGALARRAVRWNTYPQSPDSPNWTGAQIRPGSIVAPQSGS